MANTRFQDVTKIFSQKNHIWAFSLLLLVYVLILWWPPGIHITAISDSWVVYKNIFDNGPNFEIRSRGLSFLPRFLAMQVNANSFVPMQAILAASLFFRGLFIFLTTIKYLPRQPLLCMGASLLAVIYPADTGNFWVGALGIHSGIIFATASIWLFSCYLTNLYRSVLFGAIFCSIISLWFYPVFAPPLIFVSTALTFIHRPVNLQFLPWLGFNFSSIALLLSKVWELSKGNSTYLVRHFDMDLSSIIDSYSWLFEKLFAMSIMPLTEMPDASSLIFGVGLITFFLFLLLSSNNANDDKNNSSLVGSCINLSIFALMFTIVAYAPYSITDVRFTTLRTLIMPSAGAGLILASLYYTTNKWRVGRILYPGLITLTLIASLKLGLDNRNNMYIKSKAQVEFLEKIEGFLDRKRTPDYVLVVAPIGEVRKVPGLSNRSAAFSGALRYITGKKIDGAIVSINSLAIDPNDGTKIILRGIRARRGWLGPAPSGNILVLWMRKNGSVVRSKLDTLLNRIRKTE